jgi:transcriptional regulator of nitric oxide reductase
MNETTPATDAAEPRWQKRAHYLRKHTELSGPSWDRLIKSGAIRSAKIGGALLIDTASVDEYFERMATEQAAQRAS